MEAVAGVSLHFLLASAHWLTAPQGDDGLEEEKRGTS